MNISVAQILIKLSYENLLLKSAAKKQNTNTILDAFVNYLETVYFEGASEDLKQELVNFECEAYKSYYGN